MAQTIATFDTAHAGALHDAQLDYYGKRLATASSDHTVRVWDVSCETPVYLAELRRHEGPVWQVSWAHPKFGGMVASCSYDKRVVVWQETQLNEWKAIYEWEEHSASVNGIEWAPWEYGLHLACASSDGTVSVLSHYPDNSWSGKTFQAHANGVNSVSWGPSYTSATLTSSGGGQGGVSIVPKKLVTGGCDNQVRIWRLDENIQEWSETQQMTDRCHRDWVRDVAWRPNVGVPGNTIASCSEDETVIIWTQEMDGQSWKNAQTIQLGAAAWRVSWSVTGTVLAVASGDARVTLFKESLDGRWEKLTNLADSATPHTTEQSPSSEPQMDTTATGYHPSQIDTAATGYHQSQIDTAATGYHPSHAHQSSVASQNRPSPHPSTGQPGVITPTSMPTFPNAQAPNGYPHENPNPVFAGNKPMGTPPANHLTHNDIPAPGSHGYPPNAPSLARPPTFSQPVYGGMRY